MKSLEGMLEEIERKLEEKNPEEEIMYLHYSLKFCLAKMRGLSTKEACDGLQKVRMHMKEKRI